MTATLKIEDVTSGYTSVPVLNGVSVTVSAGEVVALLGRNGAGKTTLLLTAAGVIPPIGGTVTLNDVPLTRARPHHVARQGLTLIPEERGIFYQLTVRENLELRQKRHGPSIDQVVAKFPALPALMSRRAGLLSGGEQQMLAISCAMMGAPKVLMIDELSLGLAPIVVQSLLPVVRELASSGVGVLLVEQHVHAALQIADRAYVMDRGSIVLQGDAREIERNQKALEAAYLGERTEAAEALASPSSSAAQSEHLTVPGMAVVSDPQKGNHDG